MALNLWENVSQLVGDLDMVVYRGSRRWLLMVTDGATATSRVPLLFRGQEVSVMDPVCFGLRCAGDLDRHKWAVAIIRHEAW